MEDTVVFTKLREYGKSRSELQNFCSQNIHEILKHLPNQILISDGDLNKLFPGLSHSRNLENKIEVVDTVLNVLRKKLTSLSHHGTIISRVCLELPCLPSHAIIRWCNESVESIKNNTDVNMIWRDVLPECLNAISLLGTVSFNDSTVKASEYRIQTLEQLLKCQWKESQLIQLTAMLKDLHLDRSEHRKFVVKICSFIRDMSPTSLPPLVHQLLKFCKLNNVEVVLAHLSNYFNLRLYSKLASPSQDSESTTMDVDDIEQFNVSEVENCLSTCIFHMTDAAAPETILRQLKWWPRSQLTCEPFILSVALAMIDKGSEFKTVCLEVLRSAILQSVLDEIRRKESAWMRRVIPAGLDLDETLKELATSGDDNRSSTWVGLIHLSFALMSCARGPEARQCAVHGATTLARLAKAHPSTAPYILSSLADRLAADSSNLQRLNFIECLRLLCKTAPLTVEPCPELRSILESCQPAPNADGVFAAVHPLINYSERVRDILVMACRKGLYSRDSAHRCLAASGILTVLKHLRISGAAVTSTQDNDDYGSQCSQSYMSVLTVDVHASQMGASVRSRTRKDTICHEMVSILRRCLGQDASVKQLLYTRWYSCVKDKPSVHNTLLEMLYEHLGQYLPEDGDLTLLIDKCVQVTSTNAVLIEPIGYLLYLIAQLLQSTPRDDVERILASQGQEENLPRSKLNRIMADLSKCNLLEQIDIENLKVSDASVEYKATCIKIQQLLQVYEALAAHHVMQWSPEDGYDEVIYHIYKNYTQLLDNTKSPTKTSKKASKLNDTIDSTKSRKSQASGRSQRTAGDKEKTKKTSKTVKDKDAFKPLPCLWDLKVCFRILELLYSSQVSWSSSEQRQYVRGRGVLHRWATRAVSAALQRAHDTAHAQAHAPRIAALLYQCCLCRFQDLYDFDSETALGCLEMFDECLNLLSSPKYNCDTATYLSKITDKNTAPAVNKTQILNKVRSILFTAEYTLTQSESAVNKRLTRAIMEVLVTVLKISTEFHIDLSKEISKLENHVRDSGLECVTLAAQLLTTVAAESCETTLLDDLLKRLEDLLVVSADDSSIATQSTQETVQFRWVQAGAGSAGALRSHVSVHLQTRLAWVKHTTTRARDLAAALSLAVAFNRPNIEKELKEARLSCVLQLCQVARAVRSLCALRGGAGGAAGADGAAQRAATVAARLLGLAVDFLRTLDIAAAKDAGLENLLKLLGNPFTLVLRELRERLDGKLVPRIVRVVENFRSHVFRLDRKGEHGFQKYVSERIAIGMEIRTASGDNQADAMDETGDFQDTADLEESHLSADSDADTVVIDQDEDYRHL